MAHIEQVTESAIPTKSIPFTPLPPDPVIIVIPDSPEGLCDPPALVTTAPVTAPVPVRAPAPSPHIEQPVPQQLRLSDTDFFWLALLWVKYSAYVGLVGIVGYFIVYPIVQFLALMASVIGVVATGVGALLIVGAVVVGVWRLVGAPASLTTVSTQSAITQPATRRRVSVRTSPVTRKEQAPIAHLVGRRGTACGVSMPRSKNASRHHPHCPDCVTATRSVTVSDDGVVTYL
jgi:hypothetical protein